MIDLPTERDIDYCTCYFQNLFNNILLYARPLYKIPICKYNTAFLVTKQRISNSFMLLKTFRCITVSFKIHSSNSALSSFVVCALLPKLNESSVTSQSSSNIHSPSDIIPRQMFRRADDFQLRTASTGAHVLLLVLVNVGEGVLVSTDLTWGVQGRSPGAPFYLTTTSAFHWLPVWERNVRTMGPSLTVGIPACIETWRWWLQSVAVPI